MGAEFSDHETAAMAAALRAARRGHRGANPLVGAALLTADGRTVTGFHAGAGAPHAEVDAIAEARRLGVDLSSSTLFVTLEPCSHRGRTGPCTQAILDAGIPEVVFALPDSHAIASGGGTLLAEAGVRVRSGLGRDESAALNARWRLAVGTSRPFVTAKIAQSLDGRAAAADGTSQWITSAQSREHAHLLRSRVGAIIVGTGTASADNPRLSARDADGRLLASQPLPVVIGVSSLPAASHLARNPKTLHVRTRDVHAALSELDAQGIEHVLVEGGPSLLGSFFAAGVVDEVFCYQAPTILGPGRSSLEGLSISTLAESISLVPDDTAEPAVSRLGPDVLLHFAPAPPAPTFAI
ncbi:diaminohydroxyphosphoribosylaminopyrimidine deaminase/5-amino-6-(5-phosphoribosylamino)uracil reductase [Brevibacterium sanguinis]|uniref:Riboflavin biosynthesis protein RibD n=2 Tax=Brevibacterium TaxID=1696 RepID=A0A366IDS5_9MICO|nr:MULTISPECIES: bifunctional diaminohydroxyphosphoribosylaminopyrimidine deaminase/5-amino-6-(5-phosphoribosylamino)uracil reductase RibD [Brevibacterium]RBP62537.1 diaminohydroxyphosphoribosylaminopyrimidine deaminase/5-amino-6-(5-phosphoribosylamino)uracil reductase [Brevibacterium sanguinis]RBP69201.1 diaminohydroxyphosphoribosylaminopyrimidine deaminase/5-amino-6-(5-phosphoribosylamino)uracil reductase [Brevibacterium celere]